MKGKQSVWLLLLLWAVVPCAGGDFSLITLYSFTGGADGGNPNALTLGNDGSFYGTTRGGGTNDAGTVFQVTTNGTLTTLYSFTGGADGAYPNALTQGNDGSFYGTTQTGSASIAGTVFRLRPIPHCAIATAAVTNGFVVGATVTDGGYGYTNIPLVRLIGGGGSGAQAVAIVSNWIVIAVNILDAGYGYTNQPEVVIEPPFIFNPVLGIAPMSFLAFSNLTLGGVYQLQRSVAWYWSNQPVSFTATMPSTRKWLREW